MTALRPIVHIKFGAVGVDIGGRTIYHWSNKSGTTDDLLCKITVADAPNQGAYLTWTGGARPVTVEVRSWNIAQVTRESEPVAEAAVQPPPSPMILQPSTSAPQGKQR